MCCSARRSYLTRFPPWLATPAVVLSRITISLYDLSAAQRTKRAPSTRRSVVSEGKQPKSIRPVISVFVEGFNQ